MASPLNRLWLYSRTRPSEIAWSLPDGDVSYLEAYQSSAHLAAHLQEQVGFMDSRVAIAGNTKFQAQAATALLSLGNIISIYPSDPSKRSAVEESFYQLLGNDTLGKSILPTLVYRPERAESKGISRYWQLLQSRADFSSVAFFTSGTTGRPKLIQLDYQKLLARHATHRRFLERGDRAMTFFPLFSAIGFYFYMDSVLSGRTYISPGDYAYTKQQIEKWKVNSLTVSPAAIQEFIKLAKEEGYRPDSIKKIICTGGAISNQLAKEITDFFGCSLEIHYGSTETGKVSVVNSNERNSEGDQGQPLRGVKVEIVDQNDKVLSQSEKGRVRIKTNTLAKYLEDFKGIGSFDNGYFYPGDLGRILPGNRIEVSGRADLVANLSGVKVNLEEYEKFGQDNLSLNCVAFVFQDPSGITQVGIGFTDLGLDQVAISTSYQMRFGKQSPALFAHLKSIPLTESGKPNRQALSSKASSTEVSIESR